MGGRERVRSSGPPWFVVLGRHVRIYTLLQYGLSVVLGVWCLFMIERWWSRAERRTEVPAQALRPVGMCLLGASTILGIVLASVCAPARYGVHEFSGRPYDDIDVDGLDDVVLDRVRGPAGRLRPRPALRRGRPPAITSRGRPTPEGVGARRRSWCRGRGPGITIVSGSSGAKSRRSIDSMIVSKSAFVELGVAGPAGEQRVAREQQRLALDAGSTSTRVCGRA